MDVLITEAVSGKLISTCPVVLGGQNYHPTEQEYFNEAWRCAVDDGLVNEDRRSEYRFSFGD
jgi:hypothetical protein